MSEKLKKMLKYVSEHNEFYKNRIKEYGIKDPLDITQWPILTRKELQENRYNMFSDGYKSKYYNQQLRRQSSSGSSGIPVNVYWDYTDWYVSNMSLWRKRLQWYGIKPSDKHVLFTLNAFNVNSDSETVYYIKEPANILSINISMIQNESGYEKLIDIINEFEPKWLYIQPIVLNKLSGAYKRTGKMPPKTLLYIESVGELLSLDLRRRAIEFFNVPIADLYGSEEMNGIAYECPEHHMHILDDNVLIEVNNESGISNCGMGEAIITNLNNLSMPLIRYRQGDCVVLDKPLKGCKFDALSPVITMHKGRTLENIILEDGTELNAFALLELISEINNQFNYIVTEYQYIFYKSRNHLECNIAVSEERAGWFNAVKGVLTNLYTEKIGYKAHHVTFKVSCLQSRLDGAVKSSTLKIME